MPSQSESRNKSQKTACVLRCQHTTPTHKNCSACSCNFRYGRALFVWMPFAKCTELCVLQFLSVANVFLSPCMFDHSVHVIAPAEWRSQVFEPAHSVGSCITETCFCPCMSFSLHDSICFQAVHQLTPAVLFALSPVQYSVSTTTTSLHTRPTTHTLLLQCLQST